MSTGRSYAILPNTAGCATAEEAVRIARMARAMGLSDWIKVEVIPDPKYLLPDPIRTLRGLPDSDRRRLRRPAVHRRRPGPGPALEEIGTATVMPLGSPIGSGQGLINAEAIKIIVEQASVPVVVDAGIGVPSDAAQAMELGADACLVNTAIALADDPALMAEAMAGGVSRRSRRRSWPAAPRGRRTPPPAVPSRALWAQRLRWSDGPAQLAEKLSLYLVADPGQTTGDFLPSVEAALANGVTAVQLRAKHVTDQRYARVGPRAWRALSRLRRALPGQ